MTKDEKLIVSAYTGTLMVEFNEFHEWIEERLGYPVWTHDFLTEGFWADVKDKLHDDFMRLCKE